MEVKKKKKRHPVFMDWKSILLGYQYYPKLSIDSMKPLSKFQ